MEKKLVTKRTIKAIYETNFGDIIWDDEDGTLDFDGVSISGIGTDDLTVLIKCLQEIADDLGDKKCSMNL